MPPFTLDRFPELLLIPCLPLWVVLGLVAGLMPGSPALGGTVKRAATRKVAKSKKPPHGQKARSEATFSSAASPVAASSSSRQKSSVRSSSGAGRASAGSAGQSSAKPSVVASASTTASTSGGPSSVADPGLQSLTVEQQIVVLTNRDRVANGLQPLALDSRLIASAQIQASDGVVQRPGPRNPRRGPSDAPLRLQFVGYQYAWVGENIALNAADAPSVETLWMNSPPHRANILSPFPTSIGVAVDHDSQGEPYYCVVFGVPQ